MCFPHVGAASGLWTNVCFMQRAVSHFLHSDVGLQTLFTPSCQITLSPRNKKKQLLNGLYCTVATVIIFNKTIHQLL
jgi:hypothetical protein